jgi:uncharacterized protein YraI
MGDIMLKTSSLLMAAAMVLLSGSAFAAPAKANANANIRSGPGTSYGIVASLERGEYIIVRSCTANWCKVTRVGKNGYVARTLLYNPYYGSRGYYQFAPKTPNPGR